MRALNALINFLMSFMKDWKMLANNPKLGRVRDELSLGLRSFPVKNHIYFLSSIAQGIDVIRILNSARDIESIFNYTKD